MLGDGFALDLTRQGQRGLLLVAQHDLGGVSELQIQMGLALVQCGCETRGGLRG